MSKTTPIFLVSQPRSGSTVLQAALSNHADVATSPEPWLQLLRIPFLNSGVGGFHANFDWSLALRAAEEVTTTVGWSARGEIEGFIRDSVDRFYESKAEGKRYFLDKTPRYYYLLEDLWKEYPDARFLVLLRHPASVVQSINTTWQAHPRDEKMRYFADDLLVAPKLINAFIDNHQGDPRMETISYEDLVESPASEIARVCEWLEIEFGESMLDYGGNQEFRGSLGDPTIGRRDKLEPRKLSKEGGSICKEDDAYLVAFCRGLVHWNKCMGYRIPRPELWHGGQPTWEFEKFMLSLGKGGGAIRKKSKLRFIIGKMMKKASGVVAKLGSTRPAAG